MFKKQILSLFWSGLLLSMTMISPIPCAHGQLGRRLFGNSNVDEGGSSRPASESAKVDIHFEGLKRYYLIYIPHDYDQAKPLPLVVNMHGGGGNPAQQQRDSEMDKVADENGFIVVYPAGTGILKERLLTWNIDFSNTYATTHEVDDMGFLRAVIKQVARNYRVDKKRIYATGFSQGAIMSYKAACEMSDVFVAVAPVSGVMLVPNSECRPTRPVPIIHLHGLLDRHLLYAGGIGPKAYDKLSRPGVQESIDFWLKQDGIDLQSIKQGRRGEAEFKHYGPGKNGAEIVLWTLNDGGHTWPGGKSSLSEWRAGKINNDINASELIWAFFKKYSMP